jgi:hypothetical protein
MMEQEDIKTGGEYILQQYQVEDSSDTSDMDEEYSENEQDPYPDNFSDQPIHLRPECEEAYFQNLDNGGSEDLAFWRVVKTFGIGRCCSSGYVCMEFIKKGYEKWVTIREVEDRDISDLTEFVFERDKCVVDQARAILEKEGSITKEAFAKIEQEAGEVELIYEFKG